MPANDTATPLTVRTMALNDSHKRRIRELCEREIRKLDNRADVTYPAVAVLSLLDELAAAKKTIARYGFVELAARIFEGGLGDKCDGPDRDRLRHYLSQVDALADGPDAKGETPPAQGGADGDDRHL